MCHPYVIHTSSIRTTSFCKSEPSKTMWRMCWNITSVVERLRRPTSPAAAQEQPGSSFGAAQAPQGADQEQLGSSSRTVQEQPRSSPGVVQEPRRSCPGVVRKYLIVFLVFPCISIGVPVHPYPSTKRPLFTKGILGRVHTHPF